MKIKKFNWKKIKSFFKKKNLRWLKFLPKTLSKTERYLLSGLIIIITISGISLWYRHYLKTTHEIAAFGGTFSEGIVGQPKDLDKHIDRLTGAGLTRVGEKGEIQGDLAESWQILNDNKTYQFKIRQGYSAFDLLGQIQNKNIWSGIDASAPDDQTLVFNFKQPFSPFLYTTTEPVFSNGPYKIESENPTQVVLSATNNYWQGKAYISEIQINLYADSNALLSAAKSGQIMGYLKNEPSDFQENNSSLFQYSLPRYLDLFFNLSRPSLQDINVRTSLRDNKPLGQKLNLTLATSETDKNKQQAEEIRNKWQALNVVVEVKTYDNVTLQKDIIPNRNYDLLLYGQDYGPDPDPYPFWHSSQANATGLNLSNFSNKQADKLLEDARLSFDPAVRAQKYQDFQNILNAQVPYIQIAQEKMDYVLSNDINGVGKIYGSSEADRFLNANQWYIKTKRVKN